MNLFNNCIYSDYIYMTTDDGGLIAFNPEDSSWNWANSISGLASNKTKDLFVRGDSVFVLSEGGITIFDKELTVINFQDFNPIFFTDTDPYCIEIDRNKVILGGEGGIQWFDLNRFGNLIRVEQIDYNFKVFEISTLDTCYLLGTNRGVFRADSNFEDTTMIDSSGETYALYVSDNSIWAGGGWGCKEISSDTTIFSEDTVWTIGKIDEDIYIGSRSGLYKYGGDTLERIHGGNVRGFARVLPQNLRVSVLRGTGLRFQGSSNYIYTPGLASNLVTDLTETPDGNIYVSHKGTGKISVFDGDEWKVLNRGNPWGFSGGSLFNMESDSEGRIYFGFWYWQQVPILFCWDTQVDTMPRAIDLPISATTVTGMSVDNNNDLWLGLLRTPEYGGGNWVLKMHRVNEDSLEWTTYQDPGIIWKRVFAEGGRGMYCGNSPSMGGAGIHILHYDGMIEEVVGNLGTSTVSMCADLKGNVWAGLEDRLVYISGDNVERIEADNRFEGLAVDFQGGLWCYSSRSGLSYLNPEGNWESLPQVLSEIEAFSVEDVISPLHFAENKNLFVGTYNGLYEFDINFNVPDTTRVNVYPNPFNYERHNKLHFSAGDLGGKNILIYDVIGDLKGEYEVPSGNEVFSIDVDLSSGLYMFFIAEEGKVIHKGKFVVVR